MYFRYATYIILTNEKLVSIDQSEVSIHLALALVVQGEAALVRGRGLELLRPEHVGGHLVRPIDLQVSTNQGPVFRSRDLCGPIRGQYSVHGEVQDQPPLGPDRRGHGWSLVTRRENGEQGATTISCDFECW